MRCGGVLCRGGGGTRFVGVGNADIRDGSESEEQMHGSTAKSVGARIGGERSADEGLEGSGQSTTREPERPTRAPKGRFLKEAADLSL